jgi:hypothetical protein
LEDLDTDVEINRAWETIREDIKISAKGSRFLRTKEAYAMV